MYNTFYLRKIFQKFMAPDAGGSAGATDPFGGTDPAPQPAANPAPAPAPQPAANPAPAAKIEFTAEQQAYINELIDKNYAKVAAKFEKTSQEKLNAIQEAERLKNMSAEERKQAELEAANRKIAEYESEKLIAQFKLELAGKQLPADYADFLNVRDAETAKKAVDWLTAYKAGIEKQLTDKIRQLETDLNNANLRGPAPKAYKPGEALDDFSRGLLKK